MPKRKHIVVGIAVAVVVVLIAAVTAFVVLIAPMGTRYVAKRICSGVFLAGRDPQAIWDEELQHGHFGYPPSFSYEVDRRARTVEGSWNGVASTTVQFRDGVGCTPASAADDLLDRAVAARDVAVFSDPWPWSGAPPPDRALEAILDWAFSDPALKTRAIVVIHRGELVAERYAAGFDRNTRQMGWSMNKSVLGALIGTIVHADRLRLDQSELFPEWNNDDRARITLKQMLQMTSGLQWEENYEYPFSEVLQMLFNCTDAGKNALAHPLESAPGSRFEYSSGTTNMLALLMKRTLLAHKVEPLGYAQRALFAPLGMRTAVLEPDGTGTLLASSFGYASARDWARFGMLISSKGVVDGNRLLPAGWTELACTGTTASKGRHGAHMWPRVGRTGHDDVPADTCHAAGHHGQYVSIIPSRQVVIVRLGLTFDDGAWNQNELIRRVLDALSEGPKAADG